MMNDLGNFSGEVITDGDIREAGCWGHGDSLVSSLKHRCNNGRCHAMEQQKGGQVKSTSRAVRALRLQKGNLNFIGPGHHGPDKVCSSDILGQCQWAAEDGWAGQVVFKNGGGAFRLRWRGVCSLLAPTAHQPVKIGRLAERAKAGFRFVMG